MGIREELVRMKESREQEVRQEQAENKARRAKQQKGLEMGSSEETSEKSAERRHNEIIEILMLQLAEMRTQNQNLMRIMKNGIPVVNAHDEHGFKILLWIADEYAP